MAYTAEQCALFDKWLAKAREWNEIDPHGALHIVVADGNVDDDDIEWCLANGATCHNSMTDKERRFAEHLLRWFEESERAAVYHLKGYVEQSPPAKVEE